MQERDGLWQIDCATIENATRKSSSMLARLRTQTWVKKTPIGRLGQELLAFRRARAKQRDPIDSALVRRVTEAMSLPALPSRRRARGSVWAVGTVKNEADIIGRVVEHLFRQGVEGVLIADNGSTDDTPSVLTRLASIGPLHIARDREPGHLQGGKMNVLCDCARRAGADWIVPFDADEFWFATAGSLRDFFRSCRADVVRAYMHNLFPVPDVAFGEGPWFLETEPHRLPKWAFRSHRYSHLSEGNHRVRRPGWSTTGLRVLHVPWRSYDQFRRKGLQGLQSLSHTQLPATVGDHWRYLGGLSEEAAREAWNNILEGHAVEGIVWSPGGPTQQVDPSGWLTWDPDNVLTGDCLLHSLHRRGEAEKA